MLNILWSPATLDERRKNFYLTGSHDCNAPTLLKNTSKCCHVVRRTSYTAIGSYTREHNVAKVHHIDRLNLLQRTLRGLHDDYHTTPSMSSGSAFFLRGLREYFDFIKKNTHTHTRPSPPPLPSPSYTFYAPRCRFFSTAHCLCPGDDALALYFDHQNKNPVPGGSNSDAQLP